MNYLVQFEDGAQIAKWSVVEIPEELEEGVYVVDEDDAEVCDFVLEDGAIRPMTEDEFNARLTAMQATSSAFDNRNRRDFLMTQSDWVVTKALEADVAVPSAWGTYRQALRDITDHANWPLLEEADWPVAP
jgi:hypothetical protein